MKGLNKIYPDHRDYSLIHTFGATTDGLPDSFSIYSGQVIPNQNNFDNRFTPPLPPLPEGCTGETGGFESGIQDGTLYDPQKVYLNTPPGDNGGRDIRAALKFLIDNGPIKNDNTTGPKRTAYFNVYGSGKIDDFDAARIALWINQNEKRGVWAGTFWYPEFENVPSGILPIPSYNTSLASLHCHLITGWKTINNTLYLEDISWQGMDYGNAGLDYISRENYNALMEQPYTGAFTITKNPGNAPISLGYQVYIDHLVAFIKNLFGL